jgi:hypothetical protein
MRLLYWECELRSDQKRAQYGLVAPTMPEPTADLATSDGVAYRNRGAEAVY